MRPEGPLPTSATFFPVGARFPAGAVKSFKPCAAGFEAAPMQGSGRRFPNFSAPRLNFSAPNLGKRMVREEIIPGVFRYHMESRLPDQLLEMRQVGAICQQVVTRVRPPQ